MKRIYECILWAVEIALIALAFCSSRESGPQISWRRVLMDGSRTGVKSLAVDNMDGTLGTFNGEEYISPNGTHFTEGATPQAAALLRDAQPSMARLKEIVGHSASELDNPRDECDLPLGNLIVDMIRKGASEYFRTPVDVGLLNYGGIRIPLPKGVVTLEDMESMFPFKNYLVLAKIKGKNLKRLFDQLAKTDAFMAVSGVKVHVKNHEITELLIGGKPLDEKKVYTLATLDFLLDGGDGVAVGAIADDVKLSRKLIRETVLEQVRKCEAAGQVLDGKKDGRVIMED